jgi:hypothetical protein
MSAVRASAACLPGGPGAHHERSSFGDYCIRCRRTLIREGQHRRADDDVLEPLYNEDDVDRILAERPWSPSRRSYGRSGRRIG